MHVKDVQVEKIQNSPSNELSDTCYRICVFCDKVVRVTGGNFNACLRMTSDVFYCPFCIRNNFHHRTSRNVLIMSFRSIIGYYYYKFYDVARRSMYFTQLEKMVERHATAGLHNPVFCYDPHTYLWFVDFNRVGADPHKMTITEMLGTTRAIYGEFLLDKNLSTYANNELWTKYEKAINIFYETRKRPKDRRMLIPTLHKICTYEDEGFHEATREFVKSFMISK